ncbi:MAG: UDP-3-O-(3-hydroxymyristoyl)glucosamine N-acyltransferase [Gemmatimonadetes bacterium]|nr:UDP-3-O-(3-hydroxymyristoyl)glucosamine N-acyltransferase [Gemmatimonadota bacterium]
MKASEIAQLVQGTLEGGDDPDITGIAPLDRAGPGQLAFLADARYLHQVNGTRATLLLVSRELAGRCPSDRPRIIVPDAHGALAAILPRLYPEPTPETGVHPSAVVGAGVQLGDRVSLGAYAVVEPGARIGDRCRIGSHCVIGRDCVLGDDVVLYPHVTLYASVRVGDRSILHSGVRLGVDGFGYAFVDGAHCKIPQVGGCVIGSDVEIGANTTVDRGSIGTTEIGNGVKIDNLVQVGHNVRIGDHAIIVAQVGISGSTDIGRYATLGGQVGVVGHLQIGEGAKIAARGAVWGDVPPRSVYSGDPARPHMETLRARAGLSRLPELVKRVVALEKAAEREPDGS